MYIYVYICVCIYIHTHTHVYKISGLVVSNKAISMELGKDRSRNPGSAVFSGP